MTEQNMPARVWRILGMILAVVYLCMMAVIHILDLQAVSEPPFLLPILNTLFTGIIPLAISVLAARSYLFSGQGSLLSMGCGMLVFGCGAVLAGWSILSLQGPNVNVTVYNTGALVGAFFQLVAAILVLKKDRPEMLQERTRLKLVLAYTSLAVFIFLVAVAALRDVTSLFFVQGKGATPLRQVVLGMAVVLHLASATMTLGLFVRKRSDFHFWFGLSMLMIGMGLFAFFIQRSVGSPIGWLGRAGQYIGCLFALVAVYYASKTARSRKLPIQSAMAGLFRDANLSYHTLVETVMDPIVSVDQDGMIMQWNSSAERAFGYRYPEVQGTSIFDLVVSEGFNSAYLEKACLLKTEGAPGRVGMRMEIVVMSREGVAIPMEVSVAAMKVAEQCILICALRDLTERKKHEVEVRELTEQLERRVAERTAQLGDLNKALNSEMTGRIRVEKHLRVSEAEFRDLAEAMPQIVWVTEPDGKNSYFNQKWVEYTGLTLEDSHGEGWIKPFHPDDRQGALDAWRDATVNGTVYSVECRLRRVDGVYTWWLIRGVPVLDESGAIRKWFGTCTDIDSLKKSNERLLLATRAGGVGIFDFDIPNDNLEWDDQMCRLYGIGPDDFGKNYKASNAMVHPEDVEQGKAEVEMALRGEKEFDTEFRVVWPDGSIHSLRGQAVVERNGSGKPTRLVGTNYDITDRKRTEGELLRSLDEKDLLIRELYHRTKNTMQVINSILFLQAEKYPENHELQRLVENTEDKIQAMSLVHRMLYKSQDLSRISIKEYVRELVALIVGSHDVGGDRISLAAEVDDQEFLLDTAIPFGLILNELITNSLKHAFPGGRKGTISISLAKEGPGMSVMRYSDDGVGVPDGFEFQNQDSLGLKLVHSIGELQMMGKLSLENHDGVHCVFEFPTKLYDERV